MKRVIKSITTLVLILTFVVVPCINVNATEGESKELNELRKSNLELDRQINEMNHNLIFESQKETFYKVNYKKDGNKLNTRVMGQEPLEIESVEEVSKEEFKMVEFNEKITAQKNRSYSPDLDPHPEDGIWADQTEQSSYVHVLLEVYRLSNDNHGRFWLNLNVDWERMPYQTTNDAFGITLSNMQVLYPNSVSEPTPMNYGSSAVKPILKPDNSLDYKYPNTFRRLVKSAGDGGAGVGVEMKCMAGIRNSGWFNCYVTMNDVTPGSHQFGGISAYYISTKSSGTLSISAKGEPTIGSQTTNEKLTAAVTVNNFK